jgi:hypothetical protein
VPAQFWWKGIVRNSTVESNLNGGVTNPFRITNWPTLQTDDPALWADMNGKTFFTNSTVARNQLLKPFPAMTGLSRSNTPLGKVRTNGVELTLNRRFAGGFSTTLAYTGTNVRIADWFPSAYDRIPAWRASTSSRPHRLTSTGLYQLPFGRRKPFFKKGALSRIIGGMQMAGTFEYQPGQLIDFGNRYYYGEIGGIKAEHPVLGEWFNTRGTTCNQTPGPDTGWELCSQRQPAGFQARIFPSRLSGVRRDRTLQTNANIQKEIPLRGEQLRFFLRFDVLNVFNRYQFDNPNTDPTNTNFGTVTQQTAAVNRFLQFQGRIQF